MLKQFALLLTPAANLVYGQHAMRLSIAEFQVLNAAVLDNRISAVREEVIAGVPYIVFASEQLNEIEIGILSYLSSAYALFQIDNRSLRPIKMPVRHSFPTDLLTIQKYPGKTNTSFTRLLMNLTLFSSAFSKEMQTQSLTIFDPLCGRGTTLNQALMYGYNAAGIEIDAKDFDAYQIFLAKWLKDNRIKHHFKRETRHSSVVAAARRFSIDIGVSKMAYKSGQVLSLEIVNADTITAAHHFGGECFDAIVSDFPYGVLHGSRSMGGTLSRRPLDLCTEALPEWIKMLRPGGAVGLSWNTHVAGRDKFRDAVTNSGLEVLCGGIYDDFRHDVDSSIMRDIVIARKRL